MQTLWSRAAQAHGCHCQPCVRAASILARRSATTTRSNRRKVALSHVFTACYSAIMATAAVADAAAKDSRRKELDRKIEEARDKLVMLLEQSPAYDTNRPRDGSHVLHNADASPLGIYEALTSICVKPIDIKREVSRAGNHKGYLNRLRETLCLPPEDEWWRTPPARMEEVQDMIAAEEMAGDATHREPVNTVQFAKWAEMINNLVDQLLVETYRAPDGTPQTPDLLESGWNNIRMLRSSGYPNYRHPDLAPAAAAEARRDLNAVTRNIFRDWNGLKTRFLEVSERPGHIVNPDHAAIYRKRREYFVGKICHNLLISRFAPGIYSYNTLIAGFTRVGESRFGQPVVDSFLFQSRMKPTQMTLVALLYHYNRGDVIGFYNIIRRITAEDSRGVLLRRKPVRAVRDDRGLLRWARQADVVVAHGFVTERAKIGEPVLEALLDQLIDFEQVRHAATVLGACLREGLSISWTYVHRLVGLCVAQVDRIAALELLRILLRNVEEVTSMLSTGTSRRRSALAKHISRLVQICEINAERQAIVQSRGAGLISVGDSLDWSFRLNCLRTALWTASAEKYANDIASWGKLITASLSSGRLDLNRLEYLSARISKITSRHVMLDIENQKYQSLARIDWISELCNLYRSKAKELEQEMLDILAGASSKKHRHAVIFDRSLPLQERLDVCSRREVEERKLAMSLTRAHLASAKEAERQVNRVLYDALPLRERRKLWKKWWKRSQVIAFGPLVEHWTQYLNVWADQARSGQPARAAEMSNADEDTPRNRSRAEYLLRTAAQVTTGAGKPAGYISSAVV